MTYKVLFLDIDGTILQPDHTYTESTKTAIEQAKQNGIEVFIATGRPYIEIQELAEELSIDSFIAYNGGYAIYQDQTVVDEPMDPTIVKEFIKIAKEHQHELVLYTKEKNYFTSLDHPFVKKFNEIFQLKQNALFTEEVANQIIGATVLNVDPEDAVLYEIEENIRMSQVNVEGATRALDIIRKNVNKGEAVAKILKRLAVPKEQAIAFGDGMNDSEMLQAVGEGFAMDNAHPDLFAYAKHRTTSVSDSGIFNGLKKLGIVK
ncbi:HAD family hydrolase [Oceanobacillus polygoni]|uniref:Cof subfamily protein (Haloacid dehalogenase superfamily) n=1 Tax=Oceanobacillus polygoni TaxID=1235259 RepID=A0A9X0YTZ8_9BACI|nr:HAD family hydrolase [Oceanobacillus polygoni]MBP2078825.1 Cof subfamily protein (haloacid dehalogenase superfamily) [Oceanobacillus polygoni]